MSKQHPQLAEDAIAGEYERVRQQVKGELRTTTDALTFALTGLAILSHGVPSVRTREELTLEQKQIVSTLFRTTLAAAARQMLKVHPDLVDEVLNHEWLKRKLTVGPLKRLSREDQATKLLRVLLTDSHKFIEYRDRGLFEYDNGDTQAALAIVYGWGARIVGQRGVLQRASAIHREARDILAAARASFPDNQVVELVDRRFKLAWHSLTSEESARERSALQRIGKRGGQDERGLVLRLLSVTKSTLPAQTK
jgi:hypothetical protein